MVTELALRWGKSRESRGLPALPKGHRFDPTGYLLFHPITSVSECISITRPLNSPMSSCHSSAFSSFSSYQPSNTLFYSAGLPSQTEFWQGLNCNSIDQPRGFTSFTYNLSNPIITLPSISLTGDVPSKVRDSLDQKILSSSSD